jgi:carbon-monoxide dehydrogenase medium subunit
VYPFEYVRAESVAEASDLLAQDADARVLAGGQSLLPAMRLRLASPSRLIDLSGLKELSPIALEGAQLSIGAMARHADVARSAVVKSHIPVLSGLAAGIGDAQIRNLGTLGGSLANNDPAACYPAAVLALEARISTNLRSLAAEEFFTGPCETALGPGEIITAVHFPKVIDAAYVKFRQPASRFALVGVFVARHPRCVRVAVTGAGRRGVFRALALEHALQRSFAPEVLDSIRVEAEVLMTDLHAGAAYRSHLITVLAQRAVASLRQ